MCLRDTFSRPILHYSFNSSASFFPAQAEFAFNEEKRIFSKRSIRQNLAESFGNYKMGWKNISLWGSYVKPVKNNRKEITSN